MKKLIQKKDTIFKQDGRSTRRKADKNSNRIIHQNTGQDPYEGWESTFGAPVPAKRGHKRVHYYPYMIGGLRG